MELDELLSALRQTKTFQDHPDWDKFKEHPIPAFVSFYYTNQQGEEAYWDSARVIKIDLKKLHLIVEGEHGDPLRFEILKIRHCKNARTGEKVQDLFFELARMWQEIDGSEPEG